MDDPCNKIQLPTELRIYIFLYALIKADNWLEKQLRIEFLRVLRNILRQNEQGLPHLLEIS